LMLARMMRKSGPSNSSSSEASWPRLNLGLRSRVLWSKRGGSKQTRVPWSP
jgi:hypothetical protein